MARRIASVEEKKAAARARFQSRRGLPAKTKRVAPTGPSVVLGTDASGKVALPIPALLTHAHVIGATGSGKSNFLTLLIRQLISAGYGVCLLDPHGGHKDGLYNKTLSWLASTDIGRHAALDGRLHLIDPNTTSHVTGFNPLVRPDNETALSVVASAMLEAFERVWGEEDTHAKPTIRRVLKGTFHTLAERGLTLAEVDLLYDPDDRAGVRAHILSQLDDAYATWVMERLHRLGSDPRTAREFNAETIGPLNRIADFLSSPAITATVGQTAHTLDFPTILDDGQIVLANLQDGSQVSAADTDLLGRMLLHALFFHCKRRKTNRPYFVVIDECHRLLSGDVEHILSEARKFGIGIVLSQQHLGQLREAGDRIFHAVRANTATKMVFRIADMEEAKDLAHAVVPLDIEVPVQSLIRPVAIGQEIIPLRSESTAHTVTEGMTAAASEGVAHTIGASSMEGHVSVTSEYGGQVMQPETGWFGIPDVLTQTAGSGSSTSISSGKGEMEATSRSFGRGTAHGTSEAVGKTKGISEGLRTIYEDRPSAVHALDNLLYMAARRLRDLPTGSAFVSHGALANVVNVPLAADVNADRASVEIIRQAAYTHSPASQPTGQADDAMQRRRHALMGAAADDSDDPEEPTSFREPMPRR